MTVLVQTPVNSFAANGVTTVFNFTFLLLKTGDLDVYVNNILQALGADYSVSGLEVPAGGAITFTSAPANGASVVIQRNSDLERSTDYQDNGDLLAKTLNSDVDRLWLSMQELTYKYQLAPSLPSGSPLAGSLTLPDPEIGKYLRWNAAEDNLENADPGYYSGTVLPSSSIINTYTDLAITPAATVGMVVYLKQHTSGGLGGGYFQDTSGTITNNGGTLINNTVTAGRHWKRVGVKEVSVDMFGVIGDGVTDDTVKFQLAANSGFDLIVPDGDYRVTDRIQFLTNQKIQGGGRMSSRFMVGTDFNMAASGVVRLGTSETGAQLHDVGFIFAQADQSVRANVTQYPYAIDINGIARCIIDRIRIEGGYKGIDARGNCGGCYLGFLEIGTLGTGLAHDGSLDFFHGGHWHFWPFGMAGLANLMNVYYDGVGVAATLGASDGLNIDTLATFSQKVLITASAGTAIPIHIGKLQLDGNGSRLLVSGGVTQIGMSYSTKSSAATVTSIDVSAGTLILSNHRISSVLSSIELLASGTGRLFVQGGEFNFINLNFPVAQAGGGLLVLDGVSMIPSTVSAYTQPHVVQAAGELQVKNCTWATVGAGSGIAVYYVSDQVGNVCTNNNFGSWQYGPPSAYALGIYNANFKTISSDFISNLAVGLIKTKRLIVTTDGAGNYVGAHGVTNLNLKLLSISAYYKGASSEAIPLTAVYVDGNNVSVSGAGGAKRARISFKYTETSDAW